MRTLVTPLDNALLCANDRSLIIKALQDLDHFVDRAVGTLHSGPAVNFQRISVSVATDPQGTKAPKVECYGAQRPEVILMVTSFLLTSRDSINFWKMR